MRGNRQYFVLFFLYGINQEVPWCAEMKNALPVFTPNRAQLFLTNSFFFIVSRDKLAPWREPAAKEKQARKVRFREVRGVHNQ